MKKKVERGHICSGGAEAESKDATVEGRPCIGYTDRRLSQPPYRVADGEIIR